MNSQQVSEVDQAVLSRLLSALQNDSTAGALLLQDGAGVICTTQAALALSALLDANQRGTGGNDQVVYDVLVSDLVGEYETPDNVPEWQWIEANGIYPHRANGTYGIWEFMINLSCEFDTVPEALAECINSAKRRGVAYILFHQGT